MKVCIVTTSYPRNAEDDAGIFVGRLVQAYSKIGLEGEVIVPLDDSEPLVEQQDKFSINRFSYGLFTKGRLAFGSGIMPNLRKAPLLVFQIPGLIIGLFLNVFKRANSNCIFHANWIISGFAIWLVSLVRPVNYIITLRGEDVRLLQNPIVRLLFKPAIKKASYITSVNVSFLDRIQDYYSFSDETLKCIPNGVSLAETSDEQYQKFLHNTGFSTEKKYGLFIGSVIPRKKIEALVEIFSNEALKEYELIVCGRDLDSSYLNRLQTLLKERDMIDRVHFMGLVSPNKIPMFFKLSQFYISASEFEGRPNSVLEAFLAQVPVLVSDIPSHREIVTNRENGFVFKTANEVAQNIVELDRDFNVKEKVITNATQYVSKYSWEEAANRYRELFDSTTTSITSNT